jgi:hypothetical protein
MTDIINVYKVPSCFIAVRVHDRQHCLKCKCKTNYSMVYDFRFKIISENKLIQKNRCIECNTIRRSFCKYKKYSQVTGYPILFPQQKMLRYVVPTWISTVVSSLVIDFDEMLTYRMDYNMAKPKLKRARLPRKYPHNRTQPYPPNPNIQHLNGDDYVRAVRMQQQPGPYSPSTNPNPNHNRDYYNYRNNIVQPRDGAR